MISSRCKKIYKYIYMSKGRKCKKRKKKVLKGGSYSWCCNGREVSWASRGPPTNREAMSSEDASPYGFHCQQPSVVSFSSVFLFPFFFFLKKKKQKKPKHLESSLFAYGGFMSSLLGGTRQDFRKTLVSTLQPKDIRHEILNVVCTEVTLFCPPSQM